MIHLDIQKRLVDLSHDEQHLATATLTRTALKSQFLRELTKKPSYSAVDPISIHETILKRMITKYSEQLVYKPLEELLYWFTYDSGAFIEPGYPPLFYSRDKNRIISPNKSAVAGIGEGISGFLAQRLYRCRKLARPIHDYPDIIAESGDCTYLFESKATVARTSNEIKNEIDSELPRLAAYIASCSELDTRPVKGVLIGTAMESETLYRCYITEITTPHWNQAVKSPPSTIKTPTQTTYRVSSEADFILTNIIESIHQRKPEKNSDYSSTLELSLTELIRNIMRSMAQENIQRRSHRTQLLQEAINLADTWIKEKLESKVSFHLSKYSENIKNNLRFTSQEMEGLTTRLIDSRERSRVGDRYQQKSKKGIRFEFIDIGLRDMLEGILVRPINTSIGINIESAKSKYDIEGTWFPFKITAQRYTFVVDDDGTIFVSTDNLPPDLVYEVKEILHQVASDLYTL